MDQPSTGHRGDPGGDVPDLTFDLLVGQLRQVRVGAQLLREAAVRWTARVSADAAAEPDEWHVLLASEGDISRAKGSWKRLRELARTDHDG